MLRVRNLQSEFISAKSSPGYYRIAKGSHDQLKAWKSYKCQDHYICFFRNIKYSSNWELPVMDEVRNNKSLWQEGGKCTSNKFHGESQKPGDSNLEWSQGFTQDSFPNLMRCSSSAPAGKHVCLHVVSVCAWACSHLSVRVCTVCVCAIIVPLSRSDMRPTTHIPLTAGWQWKFKSGS